MANLKEIRTRITSVASTMQITSAMKMVSAAKLKRAQNAITQMRPYAEKLREILVNISSTLEGSAEGVYSQERETKKVLIVALLPIVDYVVLLMRIFLKLPKSALKNTQAKKYRFTPLVRGQLTTLPENTLSLIQMRKFLTT